MARSLGVELLAAISLCAAVPLPLAAQGGWRSWDLVMRDGTRIEADPLAAPDDAHLAISVGGSGHKSLKVGRRLSETMGPEAGVRHAGFRATA